MLMIIELSKSLNKLTAHLLVLFGARHHCWCCSIQGKTRGRVVLNYRKVESKKKKTDRVMVLHCGFYPQLLHSDAFCIKCICFGFFFAFLSHSGMFKKISKIFYLENLLLALNIQVIFLNNNHSIVTVE